MAKRLVIVGGGFCGAYIAQQLQNNFEVTLIEPSEHFEFTPSVLRVLVKPKKIKSIIAPYYQFLSKTRHVQKNAKTITPHAVITENDEQIHYDYLVIASGSAYSPPFKNQNMITDTRAQTMIETFQAVTKVNTILIIGAGLVGVELASELAVAYPHKKIILLDSNSRILSRGPLRVSSYAQQFLEHHRVEIVLSERIESYTHNSYLTSTGRNIHAQLVFTCVGISPRSAWLQQSHIPLNERGFVMVEKTLQVHRHHHIFAGGDIVDIPEEKTGQNAEAHAKIIIQNLLSLNANQPLIEYQSIHRPIIISLGPYDGILYKDNFRMKGFLTALIKDYVQIKSMKRYKK